MKSRIQISDDITIAESSKSGTLIIYSEYGDGSIMLEPMEVVSLLSYLQGYANRMWPAENSTMPATSGTTTT